MKVLFLKDYKEPNVAKGREITVYIYRYDERLGDGYDYKINDVN